MKLLTRCRWAAAYILAVAICNSGHSQSKGHPQLEDWLVLGPVPAFRSEGPRTADAAKRHRFDADLLNDQGGEADLDPRSGQELAILGNRLTWREVKSVEASVNLDDTLGQHEWSIAYAAANLEVASATDGVLGIGSDDAARVWVNGNLVHDHWASRSLSKDADLVPVHLQAGSNRIVLKILNRKYTWGFSCRVVPEKDVLEGLAAAAARGDLELLQRLRAGHIDIDGVSQAGLSPYQVATIRGYEGVAKWLAEQGANTKRPFPKPEEALDQMLSARTARDEPGLAVLVSRAGQVVFQKGYGMADLERAVPISANTKFRIGSVTKQFTAAAILKLQEEGRLSVHDRLSKFISDYPRGDEVTLHHMLTHTSGISNYTSKPDFFESVGTPIQPRQLIDYFRDDEFDFDPGKKWAYSNSGYFLLGHIVGLVSGQHYADFLQQHFFAPLGMRDTGVHTDDPQRQYEALGYSLDNGKFEPAMDWDMSRAGAAGALYSTVGDLARWNEALFSGRVLNQTSLSAAFTKVETPAQDNALGYGYGWMMADQRGLRTIGHSGGLHGFVSHLVRFPDHEVTVAVLHNAMPSKGERFPQQVASQVAELYLWKHMKPQTRPTVDPSVDPKIYPEFAGRYDYGGAIMVVTAEDNRLFAQLTGQPKFEIYPASTSQFFWKVVEAEVEFLRDPDGNVEAVRHTQNGQTFRAAKLEEETRAKVGREVLERHAGTYDMGPVGKLVVRRKGDHLAAKLGAQPEVDVFPKTDAIFFYEIIKAQLEFFSNDRGQTTRVMLRQGPVRLEGKRVD